MTKGLSPELRQVLQSEPGTVALGLLINGAAAFLVKVDQADAASMMKQHIIIVLQPEMAMTEYGAAFRFFVEFRDKAKSCMRFESYLNPAARYDGDVLRQFARTDQVAFYVYDVNLEPVGAKRIQIRDKTRTDLRRMLVEAAEYNKTIARIDFAAAKAAVPEWNTEEIEPGV